MLNSRKGNLSCFQWEVERFQRIHRETMAAVASQTKYRPTPETPQQRRKSGLCKTDPWRKLAEIDFRRKNALLVEKMVHIHRIGGFQRRSLHEFQDCKAPLEFGKTNVGVSRAAHERRFTQRKKRHELVRRENAKIFMRLASPKRSGIDFDKFEADFAKSRLHRRLAECNRTVGHTSVFSPCFGAGSNPCSSSPSHHQGAHACRSGRQRPASAGLSSSSQHRPRVCRALTGKKNRHRGHNSEAQHTADGGSANASIVALRRPHTALGLRRVSNHCDLFDGRAADPGWVNGAVSMASRPPSAPERIEWGRWGAGSELACTSIATQRRRRPLPKFSDCGGVTEAPHKIGRQPHAGTTNECKDYHDDSKVLLQESNSSGSQTDEDRGRIRGENDRWSLGRTLLAEAMVLIGGGKVTEKLKNVGEARRGRTIVNVRFLSVDGLTRQHKKIRKTLRGFVVEASFAIAYRTSPTGGTTLEGKGAAGGGGSRIGSTSVAVSAVQEYLKNAVGQGTADDENTKPSALTSFREALPLDERGNYPDLNSLLGQVGQRALCQTLLASCRVITPASDGGGKVGVQVLLLNTGGGDKLGISVTTASGTPPGVTTPPQTKPDPQHWHRRQEAMFKQLNQTAPDDGVRDNTGREISGGLIRGSAVTKEHGVGSSMVSSDGNVGLERGSSIVIRMPPAPCRPSHPSKMEPDGGSGSGDVEEDEQEGEDSDEDDAEEED